VSLNISGTQSDPEPDPLPTPETAAPDPARAPLIDDLVAELTSWNPREFIMGFRRLHKGTISLVHLNVMTLLETDGPMPMGRLADALDVSVASMTGIVTRMETRGLVERVHAEHDRRVVLVRIAEAGADVFRGIDDHRRQGLQKLATCLTEDQLRRLLDGHRALREARLRIVKERNGLISLRSTDTGDQPEEESAPR